MKIEEKRLSEARAASRQRSRLSQRLRLAATGSAAAIALAACGSTAGTSNTAAKSAAVQHISLWESHSGGPVAATVTAMVDQFNKSHKGVQVSINVTKASTKALAAVAAGTPPLLVEISHYDGKFVQAHALVDLNKFIYGKDGLSASQRAAFWPSVWKNGMLGTRHYRLQVDAKVSEYFYNKALFAKAGITSMPATWTALQADLVKLKALGVTPLGIKDSSAHIEPIFVSNGGHLLKPGSNGKATDYNSPAGRTTFSFMRGLMQGGLAVFGHGSTLRADLASGKMAIIDGTSAGYQKVLESVGGKFGVGAMPYPAGTSGHSANMVQGLGFVIMKGHPLVQEKAAWEFVKWYLAGKQQAYWAMHSGFAPETSSALKYIPSSYLSTHPGLAVSIQEVRSPYTFPRVNEQNYSEVEPALDAAYFNVLTGKQPIGPALAALDAKDHQYLTGASAI